MLAVEMHPVSGKGMDGLQLMLLRPKKTLTASWLGETILIIHNDSTKISLTRKSAIISILVNHYYKILSSLRNSIEIYRKSLFDVAKQTTIRKKGIYSTARKQKVAQQVNQTLIDINDLLNQEMSSNKYLQLYSQQLQTLRKEKLRENDQALSEQNSVAMMTREESTDSKSFSQQVDKLVLVTPIKDLIVQGETQTRMQEYKKWLKISQHEVLLSQKSPDLPATRKKRTRTNHTIKIDNRIHISEQGNRKDEIELLCSTTKKKKIVENVLLTNYIVNCLKNITHDVDIDADAVRDRLKGYNGSIERREWSEMSHHQQGMVTALNDFGLPLINQTFRFTESDHTVTYDAKDPSKTSNSSKVRDKIVNYLDSKLTQDHLVSLQDVFGETRMQTGSKALLFYHLMNCGYVLSQRQPQCFGTIVIGKALIANE